MKPIVIDIDGWLTEEDDVWDYSKRSPRTDRVNFVKKIRDSGAALHISSRRMARDRKITERWLAENRIGYDSLELVGPVGAKSPICHDNLSAVNYTTSNGRFRIPVDFATNAVIRASVASLSVMSERSGQITIGMDGKLDHFLVDFLNALLSDPRTFNKVSVKFVDTGNGADWTGDDYLESVVCFDAGISSICALNRTEGYPIYFSCNHPPCEKEWEGAKDFGAIKFNIEVSHLQYFLMASVAAMFSNNVFLALTMENDAREFFERASEVLSKCYDRKIIVSSPFLDMTKAEVVKEYLGNGGDVMKLRNAVNCHSDDGNCGICESCVGSAISLRLNDVYVRENYMADPFESDIFEEMVRDAENGAYDGTRNSEILTVNDWRY